MDSVVEITLIICITIIIINGMGLIKDYLNGGVTKSSAGKMITIKPPRAESGIKYTSKVSRED